MTHLQHRLKIAGIGLIALNALYVAATAIFFNTGIFRKIADMNDDELTCVDVSGVLSPIPGLIWIHRARVSIRDQNVTLNIDLEKTWAWFEVFPLFSKKAILKKLHVRLAKVDLGMKDDKTSMQFLEKHTEDRHVNLDLKKSIANTNRMNRITIDFKKIQIDRISELHTILGKFETDFSLLGGFRIQPGVEVEVYPTTLQIHSATLPGQLSDVTGTAQVQFDRFFIPDAPGNAVFPYLNGKLELSGRVQGLNLLNVTLRALQNQYGMESRDTEVKATLVIKKGRLQAASEVSTGKTKILLKTPDLTAQGTGQIKWFVDRADTSKLQSTLQAVKVKNNKKPFQHGKIETLKIDLNFFGNDLIDAFHGLVMKLDLKKIKWNINHGTVAGNGRLTGIAGTIPLSERKRLNSEKNPMKLVLSGIQVVTDFLPALSVDGIVTLTSIPIDFSANTLMIPDLQTHLSITVKDSGITQAKSQLKNTQYFLAPSNRWKGAAKIQIKDTRPIVEGLRLQNKIGGVAVALASVENLETDFDWELGQDFSWFRFKRIHSNGIWKAYGSLMNEGSGTQGAFEVKVLEVPFGIKITPMTVESMLFPSERFYLQTLQ